MAVVKLSLCMIVKNEAEILEKCLNSVKDLVDEIIIVDTGSTDKTKEISQRFIDEKGGEGKGGKIIGFPWIDDFSAARNEALKHATGNWILVVDADEVIAPQDHEKIKQALQKASATCAGFYITIRNYLPKENSFDFISKGKDAYKESRAYPGWKALPVIRLFRKGYVFTGRIHESVEASIQATNNHIKHLDIPIHHFGHVYATEKIKQKKLQHYFSLGEKKLKEQPSVQSYHEQGRRYLQFKKYKQALSCLQRALELDPGYHFLFADLIFCCHALKRYEDMDKYYQQAMDCKKNDINSLMAYGFANIERRSFDKSINAFTKVIHVSPRRIMAHYALAVSLYELGNFLEAFKHITKCTKLDPHFVDAHDLLAKILIQNKQFAKAYVVLRRIIELDDTLPEVFVNLALICKRLGRQDEFEDYKKRALALGVDDKMKAVLSKS